MNFIENIQIKPLNEARFVKTALMTYEQDGASKRWEIAEVHDSVAILIYHKEHQSFIIVKQFRPPVYLKNHHGFTYELCAGICDKELSLEDIASEEILEETGYEVKAKDLQKITEFYTAVGFAGSKQTLFYACVDERMKCQEGGGVDEEAIEVIEIPVSQAHAMIFDESMAKTPGLMFSFMWWFEKNQ